MIEKTLAELTLNITDGKHGDCRGKDDSGFYFISCKDVRDGQIHYEDARQIMEEDFWDTHKRTQLEPDDILVTNSGTIGRMAFIRDVPLTCRTTFQKSVAIVKPDKSQILPKYLYYQLQNCVDSFINQSNGSAQKNLLLSTMRAFKMNIHEDEDMQVHIASILSAYDDLIENNQKQIKLLEEAAQRLYKEWFVNLRFPGHETTSITDGIPEGWEERKISDFTPTFSGGTPSRMHPEYYFEGTNLWVKTQELSDGFIFDTEERITNDAINHSAAKRIPKGSILMAMYGATIGKLGIAAREVTCNQACCVFNVSSVNYATSYLFCWLKENRAFFISQGKGAAQPNLSRTMIKNFDILVPPDDVLKAFSKMTDSMLEKMAKLQLQNIGLIEARDRLLPKLMSEEIEV